MQLPAGRFRALEWQAANLGTAEPTVLLLHGLTGMADVWSATVAALGDARPRIIALDQRGHGDSPAPTRGYAIADFVGDTVGALEALGSEGHGARPLADARRSGSVHLVGHSMGARVAMVTASRHPELVRSVAIVDIGPERWTANWRDTVSGIDRMPASFTEEEAIAFFTRNRPTPPDRLAAYLARLKPDGHGGLTWRGSPDAFKQTVISHRSRDFWRDWERLRVLTLLVRGGASTELRPHTAAEMRRRNPRMTYRELDGIGHNIPLLAPTVLADLLGEFWREHERPGALR